MGAQRVLLGHIQVHHWLSDFSSACAELSWETPRREKHAGIGVKTERGGGSSTHNNFAYVFIYRK